MIELDVRIPQRLDRLIDPRAVQWAEAQAVNRTASNAQDVGLKAVAKEMGISKSQLRKRGRGGSARSKKFGGVVLGRKATRRRLERAVTGRGRAFNATRWDGQPVVIGGRTVATTHEAYGRRQIAKRTWMLKSGAIVTRSGNSFRGVFGPSPWQMMTRPKVLRAMQTEVFKRFPGHFSSAIDFAFSAAGARVRGRRR